ncbi:unnamed protein product [Spirodela intermedia]|uniref:Uncharacterized protein n=1 Tax=Spirodela intermedia TaxID=51605 RepID=A0A7I8IDT0_SPIIN|nr:unnamed protein product [Spirodela intermedia]CAA6655771.1 unnamed protein product [Spirodela intermedia]
MAAPRRGPGEKIEIRVCVNRSCNRMGSREILGTISDISPPEVTVKSCGCLGRGTMVGHCGTTARAAEVLAQICGGKRGGSEGGFDPWKNMEALTLRKKAEAELLERGNPADAEALLSQAVDLKPSGGLHLIYKSRSVARLTQGNIVGALEDTNEALKIDPTFAQAYICQGDAFMAMGEWTKAENAYSEALLIDPSIRRSKSFKERVTKLQEKIAAVHNSN